MSFLRSALPPLPARMVAVRIRSLTTRRSSRNLKKDFAIIAHLLFAVRASYTIVMWELPVFKDTHDDGAAAVCACVLAEVVAAGELLAALMALEWLVLGVEGAVVALQMLLTTEATIAELADEGLGWVLSE